MTSNDRACALSPPLELRLHTEARMHTHVHTHAPTYPPTHIHTHTARAGDVALHEALSPSDRSRLRIHCRLTLAFAGPGGRMSTRRAAGYQWDHGAQHFSPKTPGFAAAVDQWVGSGLCAAWPGDHCEWADGAVSPAPASGGAPTTRYVGAPGMNAICKGLLEGVETHYETRAVAKRRRDGGCGAHRAGLSIAVVYLSPRLASGLD